MAKKAGDDAIQVDSIKTAEITVRVKGLTPLICHRMGAKAKHILLVGGRKKTAADKLNLKHNPNEEFRDSIHHFGDRHDETAIFFPAMGMKAAMATAALELSGIKKTSVQRLVYFPDEWLPIFGHPQLRMDVVRSSDINRTPDIRTRAVLPQWWTEFNVVYCTPQLTQKSVLSLIHNAGLIVGLGDYRQERGKGNFGTFAITKDEIPEGIPRQRRSGGPHQRP